MKPWAMVVLGAVLLAAPIPLLAEETLPVPAVTVAALDAQHAGFNAVLTAVVRADGVDYAAVRTHRPTLDAYLAQLAAAPEPADRAGRLALWMNAYNAWTLAVVERMLPADPAGWPRWSIRDQKPPLTPWKHFRFTVAGRAVTLDGIEHQILRPLGDPRIHVGINCASRSCPPLLPTPFTAATVDAQLESAARAFAASPYHVRVVDGAVQTNPILSWFGEDFTAAGGVAAWLRPRTRPEVAALLGRPVTFFDYDWRLNLAGAAP